MMGEPLEHDPEEILMSVGILGRVGCGQLDTWHTIAHQNSAPMKMPGDNCAREIQQWEEDSRDGD